MAAGFSPITSENFQTAWKIVARKHRRSMKKALIRRFPVMLAQLFFGCVFLILAFGVIYESGAPGARSFLDQIPEAMNWCSRVAATILEGAPDGTEWIIRCAILLCLIPFLIAFAATVLIVLLYHPITPKQTGDLSEDSWRLWSMAKRAKEYSKKSGNDTAIVLSVLLGLFTVLFALGEKQEAVSPMQAVLYGIAVIIGYNVVNLPLRLLLTAMHFCYVPKAMLEETEHFHAQFKRPEPAVTEEKGDA